MKKGDQTVEEQTESSAQSGIEDLLGGSLSDWLPSQRQYRSEEVTLFVAQRQRYPLDSVHPPVGKSLHLIPNLC
ncbi:hypothetical protein Leryth_006379 [Lithospermum erythrorhizon]|nr:hypothetical protein Leryth_006379 [Lithospermum erythrorhizon]